MAFLQFKRKPQKSSDSPKFTIKENNKKRNANKDLKFGRIFQDALSIVDVDYSLMIYLPLLQTNKPHADIIYRPMIYHCTMNNSFVWLLLVYGFKGILLIFGSFLAWETRKVKIAALNDSHHIGKFAYSPKFLTTVKSGFIEIEAIA